MALGNGRDNPAFAGLVGQFTRHPMADRTARRLWWLASQGDDLAPLRCAEGGRRTWARSVLETLVHGTSGAFKPVATPAPDCGACRAEAACHGGGREALRPQEENLCPETQGVGRFVGTDHRVQRVALVLREGHCRRLESRPTRLLYSSGRVGGA